MRQLLFACVWVLILSGVGRGAGPAEAAKAPSQNTDDPVSVSFEEGVHTPPGAVAIRLVSIRNDISQEIRVAPYPNVHFPKSHGVFRRFLSEDIHAIDQAGHDLTDTGRFRDDRLLYSYMDQAPTHFRATHSIRLRTDADPATIWRIRGAVRLTIPAGVEGIDVAVKDFGQPVPVGRYTCVFTRQKDGERHRIEMLFDSEPADLLAVQGLDQEGQPVKWSGGGFSGTSYSTLFEAEPHTIRVFLATAFEEKEIPVDLPFSLESLTFSADEIGIEKSFSGGAASLHTLKQQKKSSKASITVRGDKARIVRIQGASDAGEVLKGGESSSMWDGQTAWMKCSFQGIPSRIELLIAAGAPLSNDADSADGR